MKLFFKKDILQIPNPTPEKPFSKVILANKDAGCEHTACALIIIPPNSFLPLHYHKARETWLFMVEGEIEETLGEKTFTLKCGDCVFIPPNEPHGCQNLTDKEIRFVEAWTKPEVEPDFYTV